MSSSKNCKPDANLSITIYFSNPYHSGKQKIINYVCICTFITASQNKNKIQKIQKN